MSVAAELLASHVPLAGPSPHQVEVLAELVREVLFPIGQPEPSELERKLQLLEARVGSALVQKLPELRRKLVLDARAALQHDPAAQSLEEIILGYPGFLAILIYRVAHELYLAGERVLARLLSEWAHARTGADIHPGARIGESFFLDHATGTVIGQTATVGDRVRLYQGVTLGALGPAREDPRHPTLEDDVVVYANATILGGRTVVGRGSVVGGSVFLTHSVPPGRRVSLDSPKLRILSRPRGSGSNGEFLPGDVYFEI